MSRVIGRCAVAGAFAAGGSPFETKAAEILVPTEKGNNILTIHGGLIGIEGRCAAFSDLFRQGHVCFINLSFRVLFYSNVVKFEAQQFV